MDDTIRRIDWARLSSTRPRSNGKNARLGDHGKDASPPMVRVTLHDGAAGMGWSWIKEDAANELIGQRFSDLFSTESGCSAKAADIDFALWDLAGNREGKPVYQLLEPDRLGLQAPCYDTSLYMNDLELDDSGAVDLLVQHTREGMERGHTAFKIKVGRGAMHMDITAGTKRDIKIINAVKAECQLVMIDANNGYNLNLAKQVLSETAAAGVYWIEEAFHEDPVLYKHLKDWMQTQGITCKIADGEGDASSHIQQWARDGFIDIIQYDLRDYGFSSWVRMGKLFDSWGVASAPHNYGEATANYYACHLAGVIDAFEYVEWDEATVDGLNCTGYHMADGVMSVPDTPGFGLTVDEREFSKRVRETGFVATST